MHRIDFFGVPGVGKSYLYKALEKNRQFNGQAANCWLTPKEAEHLAALNIAKANYGLKGKLIALLISNKLKIISPKIQKYLIEIITNEKKKDALLFYGQYFYRHFSLMEDIHREANNLHSFLYTVQKSLERIQNIAFLDAYCGNKLVLFNEAFTNRACNVMVRKGLSYDYTKRVFNCMLPPSGIVHVQSNDYKLIINRIANRFPLRPDGKIFFSKWWTEEELYHYLLNMSALLELVVSMYEDLGVNVLRIDTQESDSDNVAKVECFINQLYSKLVQK